MRSAQFAGRWLVVPFCALFAFAGADATAETSVRAQSITTAQQLAATLDQTLRYLPPIAQSIGGTGAGIGAEQSIAQLYTALAADGLADRYWTRSQEKAVAAGDDRAYGNALIARIESALGNGDYGLAEKLTLDLQKLAQTDKNNAFLAASEEYQGVLDRRRGRIDDAVGHELTSLTLRQQIGDLAGQGTALSNLGTISRDRGDFAQALDYFLRALDIRERIDVRVDVVYRNLALLYRELDDEKLTQDYFVKAIAAAERYSNPIYFASVYGSYATFLNDVHRYDEALAAGEKARAISEVLNNLPAVGFEHLEIGRALLGLNRIDEASEQLELALSIGRAIDQRELLARSELSLTEAALTRGDLARAGSLLDDAFARLDASHAKLQLAQAYDLRDRLAEAEHDMVTAHNYAHLYSRLREELLGLRSARQLAAIEVRKARERADERLQLAERTNELQAERLARSRLERAFGIVAIVGLSIGLGVFVFLFFSLRRVYGALQERNLEIEAQREELTTANHRLEEQANALYRASITDSLTGVSNRAHLFSELNSMLAACNAEQREMSLLMLDFDYFKLVNDRHGHLTGDRILIEAMRIIAEQLPSDCVLGRFGGEEFVVAFSGRSNTSTWEIAERMREAVATHMAALMPGLRPKPTISIGIALLSHLPPITKVDPLIDAADRAVYAAKLGGRNQVREVQVA